MRSRRPNRQPVGLVDVSLQLRYRLVGRAGLCLDRLSSPNEVTGGGRPGEEEQSFYVLVDDDRLITAISVETDMLQEPPSLSDDHDHRRMRAVVTVEPRPRLTTMLNLGLA